MKNWKCEEDWDPAVFSCRHSKLSTSIRSVYCIW